jgi:hypothetical protein
VAKIESSVLRLVGEKGRKPREVDFELWRG